VAKALASRAELRDVPGAGHFAFLAPCGLFGPPVLCRDADSFDRQRFHAQMNEAVVKFFQAKL
jgi:predicted dienelactone hydrolase